MSHQTRGYVLLTVAGLVAYVTGLQKKVIDPVLGAFRDLDPGIQLAILTALVLVILSVIGWRARVRRNQLRALQAEVVVRP